MGITHFVSIDADPRDRRRRRAAFLAELAEARALRERVTPRRSRRARANQLHRMSTYRHC